MPTSLNDSMKKGASVSIQPSQASSSSVVNFMKDLDKIQEQQMHYSKKIQKEKLRKAQLDDEMKVCSSKTWICVCHLINLDNTDWLDIQVMRQEIYNMKAKTRDGKSLRDEEAAGKKTIARLEKKVQLSRIQLSVSHTENSEMMKWDLTKQCTCKSEMIW